MFSILLSTIKLTPTTFHEIDTIAIHTNEDIEV